MATLSQYSRANFTYNADGTYNIFKLDYDITAMSVLGTHVVRDYEVGRPWLIAFTVYNQPRLWWFLMKYNRIKNPMTELYAGQELKYPSLDNYYALLERYRKI